jgi:hypothetical protein
MREGGGSIYEAPLTAATITRLLPALALGEGEQQVLRSRWCINPPAVTPPQLQQSGRHHKSTRNTPHAAATPGRHISEGLQGCRRVAQSQLYCCLEVECLHQRSLLQHHTVADTSLSYTVLLAARSVRLIRGECAYVQRECQSWSNHACWWHMIGGCTCSNGTAVGRQVHKTEPCSMPANAELWVLLHSSVHYHCNVLQSLAVLPRLVAA